VEDDHCACVAMRVPHLVLPVIRDGSEMIRPNLPDIYRLRLICLGNPARDDLVN
jgi:hypothetical protein